MTAEWKESTGSDEQIAEINRSTNFLYSIEDCIGFGFAWSLLIIATPAIFIGEFILFPILKNLMKLVED